MNVLAFIPARGGSKGIPKKNLTLLNGKPLLQYTIEAARSSRHITDIFLSSDDDEIIQCGESMGIKVPYKRPNDLAQDDTTTIDTVLHGLEWLKENGSSLPDVVLLLQPTSPLRTSGDIDGAIEKFNSSGTQSLISVHEPIEHPYRCLESKGEKWSYLNRPIEKVELRQDYPDNFFIVNGAIYLTSPEFLFSRKAFIIESETTLYRMPQINGLDIDEPLDLRWAEFYMKNDSLPDSH
jgi:CMP-N,N'-diacetyllegionaminic acid synthase